MSRLREYIQIALIAAAILLFAFFLGIMVNILNPLGIELNTRPKPEKTRIVKVIKKVPVTKTVAAYKEVTKEAQAKAKAVIPPPHATDLTPGELAAITAVETEVKARGPVKAEPSTLVKIDLPKAKELFDGGKAKFLDARPEFKYLEARIKGAISLSASRYIRQYETVKTQISKDDIIVVYCSSLECKLSDNVAENLLDEGYKNVVIFEAGWQSWVDAGYPVEGLKVK